MSRWKEVDIYNWIWWARASSPFRRMASFVDCIPACLHFYTQTNKRNIFLNSLLQACNLIKCVKWQTCQSAHHFFASFLSPWCVATTAQTKLLSTQHRCCCSVVPLLLKTRYFLFCDFFAHECFNSHLALTIMFIQIIRSHFVYIYFLKFSLNEILCWMWDCWLIYYVASLCIHSDWKGGPNFRLHSCKRNSWIVKILVRLLWYLRSPLLSGLTIQLPRFVMIFLDSLLTVEQTRVTHTTSKEKKKKKLGGGGGYGFVSNWRRIVS